MKIATMLLVAFATLLGINSGATAEEKGELKSGKYTITQSWSQEKDYKRPYFVHVPQGDAKKAYPVYIYLHCNSGTARKNPFKGPIGEKYITICPQGYKRSWNIVAEGAKSNDLAFIESIVAEVSKYSNVQKDNFSVVGYSNGSALANQIMIETKLTCIKNFVAIASHMNCSQYSDGNFKVRGEGNSYKEIAKPLKGKRLLNISGTRDRFIPYKGGRSPIPGTSFLAAEEAIFIWAKHMGYKGEKLTKPTKTDGKLEIFSYLDGDIVSYKVNDGSHKNQTSDKVILDFLEGKKQ